MVTKTNRYIRDNTELKHGGLLSGFKGDPHKLAAISAQEERGKIVDMAIRSACDACVTKGGSCGNIDRDFDECFNCDELEEFRISFHNRLNKLRIPR